MSRTLLPGLKSPEARRALAETALALFDRWRLDEDDRLAILGLADESDLVRYRRGEPLADDPELLERVGHLLAIDRDLQAIYPCAPALRNRWIKTGDPGIGGRSPLEEVRERGTEGLRAVRRRLGEARKGTL